MAEQAGVVNIRGKEYQTVALRIQKFREAHPDYSIQTEMIHADTSRVVMKATICSRYGAIIATGYAEEDRDSSNINKTSALENAETSAVGRALAFFGLSGTEIASADEVVNAMKQQAAKDIYAKASTTMQATLEYIDTVMLIKDAIARYQEARDSGGVTDEPLIEAARAWKELDEEVKAALWVAPSKGGPFTTFERQVLHSDEMAQARKVA